MIGQERLQAFLSQVLLRLLATSAGLSSYVESSRVSPDGQAVEISFYKLPDEVIPSVLLAFGIAKIEQYGYNKFGKPCQGFKAYPTPEDVSSLLIGDGSDPELTAVDDGGTEVGNNDVQSAADDILQRPWVSAAH